MWGSGYREKVIERYSKKVVREEMIEKLRIQLQGILDKRRDSFCIISTIKIHYTDLICDAIKNPKNTTESQKTNFKQKYRELFQDITPLNVVTNNDWATIYFSTQITTNIPNYVEQLISGCVIEYDDFVKYLKNNKDGFNLEILTKQLQKVKTTDPVQQQKLEELKKIIEGKVQPTIKNPISNKDLFVRKS